MQNLETYSQMLEHLKFFFVTMLFNVAVWPALAVVYGIGWVLGRSFRSANFGHVFIWLYLVGTLLAFIFKSAGWDLMILAGLPFMLGVYIGKKKR